LERLADLSGYWGVHALTLVAEGMSPLIPLFAVENKQGVVRLVQIAMTRVEEGAAEGIKWLETNPFEASRAVLVCDAFLTLGGSRMDAVIVEARFYGETPGHLKVALPYRPSTSEGGFAIHRAKVLQISNSALGPQAILAAFMAGIARHEKGKLLWKTYMDRSR
jgi:hypothetical protein